MNIDDLKKILRDWPKERIVSDEPHVTMRCEENCISMYWVKSVMVDPGAALIRLVEDRPKVYKAYFKLSRKRELKVVIDFFDTWMINIRTVRILNKKFLVRKAPRRRF